VVAQGRKEDQDYLELTKLKKNAEETKEYIGIQDKRRKKEKWENVKTQMRILQHQQIQQLSMAD
jgi:hypothetical protein